MKYTPSATIMYDGHSTYYVEWYRDDDNNSGYGSNPQICRWYGTRSECITRSDKPAPMRGWVAPEWEPDQQYMAGCSYAGGER